MSMQYIRDYYGVPAKRGARIRFTGRSDGVAQEGVITGTRNAHIRVRFDGDLCTSRLHPTWEVEYIEEGE